MLLKHWMLKENRQYVIESIKNPLHAAIILYGMKYLEPTRENCKNPNSHILLDAQDKLFEYYTNKRNFALFRAVFRILIGEYEHDNHYQWILDWMLEFLVNSDWRPRPCGHPSKSWIEPEPYGGGYLIKDDTLRKFKRRFKILEE